MGWVMELTGWGGGGWFMKSREGGVGHAEVEWGESYRGGVGHAVKQPKKMFSPQNQDLVLITRFDYYYNWIIFPIISKILPDASCIKYQWHDYYISSKRKKAERLPVFSMELKCSLPKQLPTKTCFVPHYPESS